MRALAALDLAERVVAVSTVVDQTEFRMHDGQRMWVMPVGNLSRAAGAPTVIVGRSELLGILASAVGDVPIRYGERCLELNQGPEHVDLHFASGRKERFDGLVGADGLHSDVRARMLGATAPRSVGQDAWVGIASYSTDLLPLGRTIATIGRGLRFCSAAMRGGRVFWYAAVRSDEGISSTRALALRFGHFHSPVEDVILATRETDAVRTVVRDRPPARAWGSGRVTLVGDAAHPSTPDLGQGACQALESAVVLSDCLAQRTVPSAFAQYQERRLDRTAKITNLSWLTAMQGASLNPLVNGLRAASMRTLFPSLATTELSWILSGHGLPEGREDTLEW